MVAATISSISPDRTCGLKVRRIQAIRTWPAIVGYAVGCGPVATCKAVIGSGPWLCLQKPVLLAVAIG